MPAASSVDRIRRSLLLSAPVALSAPLLGACAAVAVRGAPDVATNLAARLAANDRPGFLSLFASTQGAQALGRRMFANLAGRAAGFAAPAANRLQVRWALPGEPLVVSEAFLTLAGGLIANLTSATTATEWMADPLAVQSDPGVIVAAADAAQLQRWVRGARLGLEALTAVQPDELQAPRPLVVLAPADLIGFARYAGGGADAVAGVTVVPGTPESSGTRVAVNPSAPEDRAADAATVTHEAVHAAMASPRLTTTPGWLLEGIAEALTARAHPQVARANTVLARAVSRSGAPAALPDPGIDQSGYALAQVAVDAMVHQVGWPLVLAEAGARSAARGPIIADAQVLAWYRDALAAL